METKEILKPIYEGDFNILRNWSAKDYAEWLKENNNSSHYVPTMSTE